jgi:hypothetical protein
MRAGNPVRRRAIPESSILPARACNFGAVSDNIRIMASVRNQSEPDPLRDPRVTRLAAETVRKAHAVGVVDEAQDFASLTYQAVRRAVAGVREAGVAEYAAAGLERADPADHETIAHHLAAIDALIEETPFPPTEWRRLLGIFDRDRLATLLGISPASAGRYESGRRRTPDAVAARLHFLALVVGDLAGAYNPIGIRRWFERSRAALDGHRPADLLAGAWEPEEPGPARVRALARALLEPPAT